MTRRSFVAWVVLGVLAGLATASPPVYERFENSADGTIAGGVAFSTDVISPIIFSGPTPVANQYTAVFDGAAGTFVSHGTATQLTSTDFTVEAFINLDGAPNWDMIASDWSQSGSNRVWSFIVTDSGQLRFDVSDDGDFNGNNALTSAAGLIQAGNWYHVAAVSQGTTSRIYLDGVQVTSTPRQDPGIFTGDNANFKIGNTDSWGGGDAPRPFGGRLDEVRITDSTLGPAQFLSAPLVYERFENSSVGTPSAGGVSFSTDVVASTILSGLTEIPNQYTAVLDGAAGTFVNHGTATQLTSTDFTVEAFVNLDPGSLSDWNMIASDWSESGDNRAWALNVSPTGQVRFDVSNNGTFNGGNALTSAAGLIQTGNWYHVAAVSQGNDSRIYLNGVEVGSMTRAAGGIITSDTANLKIGNTDGWGGNAARPLDGRIDELRITKRPLAPGEFLLAATVYERFENSADGTISGGVTFSTDVVAPVVGSGGNTVTNEYTAVFDGAADTFVNHGTATQVTSTDFTVEAFINLDPGSLSDWSMIASDWSESGNNRAWAFNISPSGELRFDVSNDGAFNGANALTSPAGLVQTDKWYHVAAVSQGNDSRIYVDGVQVASMTRAAGGLITSDGANLKIGNTDGWGGNAVRPLDGRIDELRITQAVLGRAEFIQAERVRALIRAEDGTPGSAAGTVLNTNAGTDGTAHGGVSYSADVPFAGLPPFGDPNNVSLGFDGNAGSYVEFGDTLDVEPGPSGGLTVEAFIKPADTSGDQMIVGEWKDNSNDRVWALTLSGDGIRFDSNPDGGWHGGNTASASGVIHPDQWQHVAAVYDGAVSRLYVDRMLVAEQPLSDPGILAGDAALMQIGAAQWFGGSSGSTANFEGLIDEVRITQRALGQAGFSAPAQQRTAWIAAEDGLPPAAAGVVTNSLPGPDGTAYGGVRYASDVPVGGIALDDGTIRPNLVSLAFDGNPGSFVEFNNYLDVAPGPDGGFTVEAFIKPDAIGSAEVIAAEWNDGADQRVWALSITSDGQLRFDTSPDGGFHVGNKTTSDPGSLFDQWQHVAAVYDGTSSRLYIDYQLAGENTLSDPGLLLFDNALLRLGAATEFGGDDSQANFSGLIDEFRITNAVLGPGDFLRVPEPGSLALLAVGLVGLLLWCRRR